MLHLKWSGIPDRFNTKRDLTMKGYALTAAADAARIPCFGLIGSVATVPAIALSPWPNYPTALLHCHFGSRFLVLEVIDSDVNKQQSSQNKRTW